MMREPNVVDRVIDTVEKKVDRIREDLGHALNGDFERISTETKKEVIGAVRDLMVGTTRVDVPINDKVTVEGYRERDGSIGVSIKIDF